MTNSLRRMIIVPTIGIIILLVVIISVFTFISVNHFTEQLAYDSTQMASRGVLAHFDAFEQYSRIAAYNIASDPGFINLLRNGEQSELNNFLSATKHIYGIDFYVVLNHEARVLVRTHDPNRYGDIQQNINFERARDGITLFTFHSSPTTPFALSTSTPIYDGSEFVGVIIANLNLSDPEFLVDLSDNFGAEITLYFGDMAVVSTIMEIDPENDITADSQVVADVLNNGRNFTGSAVIGGTNHTVFYFPLINSLGEIMGMVSVAFSREHLDAMDGLMLRGIASIGIVAASVAISILLAIISRISAPIIEANERLKIMFDTSPMSVYMYDMNLNAVDCNKKAEELFGFANKDEAINQYLKTLPPTQPNGEESRAVLEALIQEAFKSGVTSSEFLLQKTDGTPIPVDISFTRMRHKGSDVVIEYSNDLSEIKAAEEKEREERDLGRDLYDTNPIPASIWNSQREIVKVNDAMVKFFGVSDKQEALDRFMEFSPEIQPCGTSTNDLIVEAYEQIASRGSYKTRWEHIIPDSGERIPCEIVMSRVDIKDDYLLAAYVHDLREIMAAEDKEREAQRFNQQLLDFAPLVITIRNANNEVLHASRQVVETFGVASREDYISQLYNLTPEFQPCGTRSIDLRNAMLAEAEKHGSVNFEWTNQTIDGESLPMNITLVKLKHHGEDIILTYAFDMRPVKEAMQLAMYREREAEVAARESKQKSRFLAQVSHEIRTPMNAVLGIAEIQLQKNNMPKDLKESLSHIRNSSYLLLSIINNLLDLSKAEAGKMEIINKPYETISLIVDTVQLNMFYMGSKRLEFIIHTDKSLPVELIGDELRIKQALNNMLSNALKYTNEGSVTLSMDAVKDDSASSDDITLVIRIEDTGRGMTQSQVRQLFGEEFLRFGETDSVEGSGLGMVITYQLVEMMGGSIEVESEPGKGTLVTMRIPQKIANADVIGEEFSQKLQNFEFVQMAKYQVADFVREPMPYGRVLIVDDVELNLYVAQGHLAPYQLDVDTAISGFEAIDKINRGEIYDVVFMDHMMPDMDGVETVKRLRDDGYIGIIVALTANALVGNTEIFIQYGFDDFLSKPIDIRDLNTILNKYISARYPEKAAKYKNEIRLATVDVDSEEATKSITKKMSRIFQRDTKKALIALRKAFADADLALFATTAHAVKPSIAYVGELELSLDAAKLEQAGKAGDMKYIEENIDKFIIALESLLEKFQNAQPNSDNEIDATGDSENLAKHLKEIEAACKNYDVKGAIAIIDILLKQSWKEEISETLQKTRDILYLDSNFDVALEMLKGIDY